MFKRFLILIFLVLAAPTDALAQGLTVRDYYVRELREDGYQSIRVSRTFLGRMRFLGTKPGYRREIIVNPKNGAILRDFIRVIGGNGGSGGESGGQRTYPGGGNYDRDDDDYGDDYDDDDDDDDHDNSGSGSSNSGSGSSNSGSGSSNSGSGSDDDDDDD